MTYSGPLPSQSRHFYAELAEVPSGPFAGFVRGRLRGRLSLGREGTRPTGIRSRALVRL
jgi:hypothetical protein